MWDAVIFRELYFLEICLLKASKYYVTNKTGYATIMQQADYIQKH